MKKITERLSLDEILQLYKSEEKISVIRDVDIGKHLSQDIIGKGKEFTSIREISNEHFNRVWEMINSMLGETFIQLASDVGIEKYIQLIDLEITGDLEEKRKKVYAIWNEQSVKTHRTLLKWLDGSIGKGLYRLTLCYNEYGIYIEVLYSKAKVNLGFLSHSLRFIIPANLWFRWIIAEKMKLCLASTALGGEETVIRPFMITELEINPPKLYMGTVMAEFENTILYPKGYTNKLKKYLDTGLYLDDDNIMDSGY